MLHGLVELLLRLGFVKKKGGMCCFVRNKGREWEPPSFVEVGIWGFGR